MKIWSGVHKVANVVGVAIVGYHGVHEMVITSVDVPILMWCIVFFCPALVLQSMRDRWVRAW